MSLKLHVDTQFASPYAMSVFVALQEKGLAFEMLTVDLASAQHRSPGYTAASLTQRVPTLVDGDFALSESTAIAEYLDEVYPPARLYPAAAQHRARARQVQAWLRSDLVALRVERPTEVIFYGRTERPLAAAGEAASAKLIAVADRLLEPGATHLFGSWCIADTDLALMLNRLALHRDPLPQRLADYAARQFERPSVSKWLRLIRPPL